VAAGAQREKEEPGLEEGRSLAFERGSSLVGTKYTRKHNYFTRFIYFILHYLFIRLFIYSYFVLFYIVYSFVYLFNSVALRISS
jgi:predicted CDP-diglyceride synthetase/phosphatidate cytidylyltransferase